MVWKPDVTVAAIVERDGAFLMVEEETVDGIRFNQPAGHLESGETLVEAVTRETLEETGYAFEASALVGVYQWRHPVLERTYLRFAFGGDAQAFDAKRPLDAGIIAAHWMTLDEIRARTDRLRSPMVLRGIEDWCAGRRYPLELVTVWA